MKKIFLLIAGFIIGFPSQSFNNRCKVDYILTITMDQGQPIDGRFFYYYSNNRFQVNNHDFVQIGPGTYRVKIKNIKGAVPGDVIGMMGQLFAPTGRERVFVNMIVRGSGKPRVYSGECPMNKTGRFSFHAMI